MCKRVMGITGTRYEQKKNKDGTKQFLHTPYCECERCKARKYFKSANFQELLVQEK